MSKYNSLTEVQQEIAKETLTNGYVTYYDIFTTDDNPIIEIEQFVVETDDDEDGEYHITLWDGEPVYFKRYRRDKAQ